MEKTILYSKKSNCLAFNIKTFEDCEHNHCKQLLNHIKFLSNTLTQKILKDQLVIQSKRVFKDKENINDQKTKQAQLSNTLQEQIQTLRKNYTKLRKHLNQIQSQNDQLFEQNDNLKKRIIKLQESIANKDMFELSLTKCNENSGSNSKSSFFTSHKCPTQQSNRNSIDATEDVYGQFGLKFEGQTPHNKQTSTDRSQIYNKYQKLIKDYHKIQLESSHTQQKLQQIEHFNKKLQYQNRQLKKIIKLRNEVQASRHEVISNLKNILDEIQV